MYRHIKCSLVVELTQLLQHTTTTKWCNFCLLYSSTAMAI